ncbi:glycosyltransferase, MGT family [Actinokineospora alba]|uniref:Glycosyltransferase, MGT family n=1 Tax=Actinokineospora alba TaxID=504798 RepID=A0A1H0M1F2_9PSEU|nr:glycosyltransferase [Actinokineospora alba]TDP67545.1 MGT family glycosyltransferase [Actinokineospora alba]SDI46001.1 glycosyltransferase, MGT family [Actinokineospora alba]SDO74121.1 glycosyltransferase, MGT family [Actinokineospora alba]
MHVLISSLPSHGHTYPLLPLAIAAKEHGHRVTYATDASFHPVLISLGFDVVDVGTTITDAFNQVTQGSPPDFSDVEAMSEVVSSVFISVLARGIAADLGPILAREKPDLVLYEAGSPGAGLAAKAAGIPVLCHAFGRGALGNTFPSFLTKNAEVAAELGVDYDPAGPFPDPYLDIYPASLQDKEFLTFPKRIPLRPVAFAEPGELPAWVAEHDKPLVYLTLGTAFGQAGVLRTAIDGLATLPARVIVAAGPTVEIADLGTAPDNVTVLPWVPQADLLPHTDLVVHHGGSGTTLGALAAGVPQLFIPQGADQFVNADAVTEGGAGVQLVGDAITVEAVAARAADLLADDAVAARSREVAAEIAAMPSPAETAATLETLGA